MAVLVSPRSGSGRRREQLVRLRRRLIDQQRDHVITSDLNELRGFIERDQRDVVIVSAGGDGTLTLATRFVPEPEPIAQGTRGPVALLPMPMGTENLLARQMGYSHHADRVIESIDNPVRRIDSMRVDLEHRRVTRSIRSLVMTTAGFDAAVVRRVHLKRRGHIRRWTYGPAIARSLQTYPFEPIRVWLDDDPEPIRCRWAMAFNVPAYAAWLSIEPGAVADDGYLDFVGLGGRNRLDDAKWVAAVAAGSLTGRQASIIAEGANNVVRRRCRTIRIEPERGGSVNQPEPERGGSVARIPVQADGDYIGRCPIRIRCDADSVPLVRPV